MANNTKKLLVLSNIFGGAGGMGAILEKVIRRGSPGVLLILNFDNNIPLIHDPHRNEQ
jgi:hypothetical protein